MQTDLTKQQTQRTQADAMSDESYAPEKRGTGWIITSGILLVFAGISLLNAAAWSFHANDVVEKTVNGQLLFGDKNLELWGWLYAISGALVVIAGIGVFFRARFAVWIGIAAALTAMIIQLFWVFTPYWASALLTVGLCALVIHGLSTYGVRRDYY
jgi:hypothetical protein